jgi:1,4-dihydroxy-2-naphthoyl-CoA hydrolase
MLQPTLHAEVRAVRFQDIDAAGIVFFARFFEYFHDAFANLLASRGLGLPELLERGEWLAPLVHAEADYRRPLRFGDEARVIVTALDVGQTSMTCHFLVTNAGGETSATGRTVHAFVARPGFQRIAVPEAVRLAFSAATAASDP